MILPPKSSLKWAHPGYRKPLPPYPIIPCDLLFDEEDKKEAPNVEVARALAYSTKPHPWSGMEQDVYFIKGSGIPHVKIGKARGHQMDYRLSELQTGSPVKLSILMVIDCRIFEYPFSIELRLHELFKQYRIHGEWFKMEGELLEFIKSSGAKYE